MKKIINFLYLVFIISTLFSCSKTGTVADSSDATSISGTFVPADPYMDDAHKNYCRGCGSSNDPNWGCVGGSCTHGYNCGYTRVVSYVTGSTADYVTTQSTLYGLRDSFLINFELGQMYITYYYMLSEVAATNNLIHIGNFYDYYQLCLEMITAIKKIRFNMLNEIPIDDDFKNKLEMLIQEFRNHTTDELLLSYLDSIQNDLDLYAGKNVAFIRNAIGI